MPASGSRSGTHSSEGSAGYASAPADEDPLHAAPDALGRPEALGRLAGEERGHRGLLQAGPAGVLQARGVVDQLARGFDLRGHVGQEELQRLVLEDRLAEGDALLAVGPRDVERRAGHADALTGEADAPAFQARQRDLQALAFVADQVGHRHAAVLEQDLRRVAGVLAGLVFQARHGVAGRGGGHDGGADALLARGLVGHRHHDRHIARLGAGDELLDALEYVDVAVSAGRRLQAARFGADMRLG